MVQGFEFEDSGLVVVRVTGGVSRLVSGDGGLGTRHCTGRRVSRDKSIPGLRNIQQREIVHHELTFVPWLHRENDVQVTAHPSVLPKGYSVSNNIDI